MIGLVGLSGYAGSGKDAAAQVLLEAGYERRAFADKLRAMAYELNPIIPIKGQMYRLGRLVDAYGWEHCKREYPEAREILQRLGTEAGRKVLGENVWVRATLNDLGVDVLFATGPKVVVTDVRFPNEAAAIQRLGGKVYRVQRPGVTAINAHPSETALDDFPFDEILLSPCPGPNQAGTAEHGVAIGADLGAP